MINFEVVNNVVSEKLNLFIKKTTTIRQKTRSNDAIQCYCNFENIDQDIIDIDLPETHYLDEEKFVKTILDCLEKEDIR